MSVIERVNRLKEGGYNPIHLLGNLYLVRNKSKRYCYMDWPFYRCALQI